MKQTTLDGGEVEIERLKCEYYDGCRGDATHVARLLENYERMVDVPVCGSCCDEILEYKDEDSVRMMTIAAQWDTSDTEGN